MPFVRSFRFVILLLNVWTVNFDHSIYTQSVQTDKQSERDIQTQTDIRPKKIDFFKVCEFSYNFHRRSFCNRKQYSSYVPFHRDKVRTEQSNQFILYSQPWSHWEFNLMSSFCVGRFRFEWFAFSAGVEILSRLVLLRATRLANQQKTSLHFAPNRRACNAYVMLTMHAHRSTMPEIAGETVKWQYCHVAHTDCEMSSESKSAISFAATDVVFSVYTESQ